jgi:hypothetical protein
MHSPSRSSRHPAPRAECRNEQGIASAIGAPAKSGTIHAIAEEAGRLAEHVVGSELLR